MRYPLFITFCIFFIPCAAQRPHIPAPAAKLIHTKAIKTYINNSKNRDSIVAATQALTKALAIDSLYHEAWSNKLTFECELGRYDSAYNTTKHLSAIFPYDLDELFFCGVMALKTGHIDDSKKILTRLIKLYDKIDDPNTDSDHLRTAELNKGLALKLLDEPEESKQLLVALSMKEKDLTIRRHINSYLSKNKEEIINDLISRR